MATLPKEEASRILRPAGSAAATAERAVRPVTPPPPPRGSQGGPALVPGAVIDGRYKIIRFLNQGGAGVVHEVEHLRTGRRLAMKTLVDDASAARLEQEARATSLMRSSHVVKITDMGPPPGGRGAPYLVMELLEGQSLRELLEDAGQLPLGMTVNIALQVCECLSEAHEQNVVHRDLKPDNLFLEKSVWPDEHDVIVLDFGVMKVAGEGPIPKGSLTRTGSTVGTPYYMSLEQLRNSSNVDARADIYSLGVVLYECLAGRKPFVADTIGDLVYALCSGPPTALGRLRPDLPSDVCDLVMRMLKMNREERPASMQEVGAALRPHGHAAFCLWLGDAQAVVPPPAPKSSAVSPSPPMKIVASRSAQEEGEGTTLMAVTSNPTKQPEEASPPTSPLPEGKEEGVKPAPMRIVLRNDRETPTEMYRGAFTNDRDTPTRALPAPSLPDLDQIGRLTAPLSHDDGRPTDAFPRDALALEGASTHRLLGPEALAAKAYANETPGAQPGGIAPPRGAETMRSAPSLPAAEPPRFGAPMDPRMTGTQPAAGLDVSSMKPGWQRSLDGALSSVGGVGEGLLKRVRAQPPPVQYAILGTVIVVGILLIVLIFVLALG